MTTKEIAAMQERIGATPDGFWGPKSISQCKQHLRNLMPKPNPFPATDQASLTAFYGKAGDESKLVSLDVVGLGIKYDGKLCRTVLVNRRLGPSLLSIFTDLAASPFDYMLERYDGVYNNRPMRGGSLPSLHARGAAIDLDAGENGNLVSWPLVATMPLGVMEIFAAHGWVAAGAFWGRDAMHMQATQ